MDQWTSLQLAAIQQQQTSGILSHQPYNYSTVFMEQNNLGNKPSASATTATSAPEASRYDTLQSLHHMPPGGSTMAASLQVNCDKVTHQLSLDVDMIMQQISKYVEDAKHHFRMTVFSLGKHLRDSVIHPQQVYGTESNPQFHQVCYNVSWEIVKTAQTVSFELTKSLDNSGKELVHAARNAAHQLGVEIPDFLYIDQTPVPPQPPPATLPQTVQPNAESQETCDMVQSVPPQHAQLSMVASTTPQDSPLDMGHQSDDTQDYDPDPTSVHSVVQSEIDVQAQSSDFTTLKDMTALALPVPLYSVSLNAQVNLESQATFNVPSSEADLHIISQPVMERSSADDKVHSKRGRRKIEGLKGPFSCEECGKVFQHQKSLRFHRMRAHTGERPYKCPTCDKEFVRAYEFKRHSETHSGKRQYKCDQCPKEFYQKKSYEFHVKKRHTNIRPYVCTVCDHGFVRRCDLRDHMLIHSKEKKFVCEHCNRAFLREKNFNQHRTIHTGEKPHACKLCGERFISMYYASRHAQLHECDATDTVRCHLCEKQFDKEELKSHVKTHTEVQEFKCDACKEICVNAQDFIQHKKKHTHDLSFVCMNKNCDKTFRSAAALERHKKTHGIKKRVAKPKFENKYVMCDVCGKSIQKGRLQEHVNTHRGKKPHKCEKCSKEYYVKRSLQIHQMVKHGGFRPFVCEECGKRFPTNYDLNKHRLVHDKKHKCFICDRTFTNGKLLIEHMTVHTGAKPFACKLCADAFARYAHLAKHCKVVHGQLMSGKKVDARETISTADEDVGYVESDETE